MADTFDDLLRVRLQETGANRNAWGGLLNAEALAMLAKAAHGTIEVTVAGADVTLTTNNGSEDQARYKILHLIGAPGAQRNIIIPQVSHEYIVRNETGSTMVITTDTGGATVEVPNGVTTKVITDGEDVLEVKPEQPGQAADSAALGGIPAASWARLDESQDFEGGQGFVPVALSMGASVTPDLDDANVFTGVLTANTTLQTPNNLPAAAAQVFYIHLQQAASGGPYTLAFSDFYDFLGDPPEMPETASYSLMLQCIWLPGYAKAICTAIAQVDEGTVDIVLAVNEKNVNLFRRAGSPAGIVTVNLTIAPGVIIHSDSPLEAALDLSGGFASGSIINITNLGYIIGKGGRGAGGGWVHDSGDTDAAYGNGEGGDDGGDAINGAGAGVTINVTNANGRIWSGGGGGGAGGVSSDDNGIAVSGGGGGGAGMGEGGRGAQGKRRGNLNAVAATDGAHGRLNLDGSAAGGAAGTGASGGTGSFSASGAGGDYGAAGTNGTADTTGTSMQLAATNGGAAGKAIEFNGSTVNIVNGSGSPNIKGATS